MELPWLAHPKAGRWQSTAGTKPLDWCRGVIILATVRIFSSDRSNPGKRRKRV
jgi:hypothetical protein